MSPDRSDVVGEKLRSGAARRCRVWLQPKQVSRIDTSGRHLQCGKSVSRVARYAFQIGPKSAQPRRGGCPPCRLCYRRLGTICATSRGDQRRGLGGIYHEPWRASAGVRCQGRWRAPRFQRRPVGSYHDDVAVNFGGRDAAAHAPDPQLGAGSRLREDVSRVGRRRAHLVVSRGLL